MPLPSAGHLILKLKAIADKIGRTPTTLDLDELARDGRSFTSVDYRQVFGSYSQALKSARLKPTYGRAFDEQQKELLLVELRRLSRKMGRRISTDDVRRARRERRLAYPVSQYEKAFGSIVNALEAADVGVKAYFTDDEIIDVLRRIDSKLDRPVRWEDLVKYQKGKSPSPKTIYSRFGNMRNARAAARIKQEYRFAGGKSQNWQKYTREELIAQLRALAARIGRTPTDRTIDAADRSECATAPTFRRMFGTLNEAYKAAGLPTRSTRYTDKDIIAALRRLRRKLGHFPTIREIGEAHAAGECPSDETIRGRLGPLTEIKEWL